MDRLGIERADYCGLSIGGMTGQWLAINAPERIARLVLICTSPDTLNPDAFRARATTVREARSTEVVADAVVANWFTEPYAAAHPDVIARHRQMIVDTPVEGYAACCEAVAGHNVRARLSQITAPTLVIAGAQDRAIPPTQGEAIAAGVAGAKLQILDPAAHIASVERADTVNALIAQHLNGAGGGIRSTPPGWRSAVPSSATPMSTGRSSARPSSRRRFRTSSPAMPGAACGRGPGWSVAPARRSRSPC